MSTNFGPVDIEHLGFPVHMTIDYIRVYQVGSVLIDNTWLDINVFDSLLTVSTLAATPRTFLRKRILTSEFGRTFVLGNDQSDCPADTLKRT